MEAPPYLPVRGVYYSSSDEKYKWHFKDMPVDRVNNIEIFLHSATGGYEPITKINNPEQIKAFLQLLQNSIESPNSHPNTDNGDPTYYQMVFYTGEPIAYKYDLIYDGHTYFWNPWATNILSNQIQSYINAQK